MASNIPTVSNLNAGLSPGARGERGEGALWEAFDAAGKQAVRMSPEAPFKLAGLDIGNASVTPLPADTKTVSQSCDSAILASWVMASGARVSLASIIEFLCY